jgi:hypothetical protein
VRFKRSDGQVTHSDTRGSAEGWHGSPRPDRLSDVSEWLPYRFKIASLSLVSAHSSFSLNFVLSFYHFMVLFLLLSHEFSSFFVFLWSFSPFPGILLYLLYSFWFLLIIRCLRHTLGYCWDKNCLRMIIGCCWNWDIFSTIYLDCLGILLCVIFLGKSKLLLL